MTHLYFQHDVLNRTGPTYGSDIPLTWYARWGTGLAPPDPNNPVPAWGDPIIPSPDITLGIPSCDHWFQFKAVFLLEYHIDDGYYTLELSGCPAPEL